MTEMAWLFRTGVDGDIKRGACLIPLIKKKKVDLRARGRNRGARGGVR